MFQLDIFRKENWKTRISHNYALENCGKNQFSIFQIKKMKNYAEKVDTKRPLSTLHVNIDLYQPARIR